MLRSKFWTRSALVLASLLLVFLGLELAARLVSYQLGKGFWGRQHAFISPFFVTYDYPPPVLDLKDGELVGTFRDGQTVRAEKDEGELRVICLGGSTTVNARNRKGWTYSGLAQEVLAQRFPGRRVEVLNAGADAFSSAHSVTNLALRLMDFQPDVVTVYHAINDISALQFGEWISPDYANKYLDDAFLGYQHRSGIGGAVLRLSRGAQMLKWRVLVLRKMLEKSSRTKRVANPEKGLVHFSRNLRSIAALAQAHGSQTLLMTQAHVYGEQGEDGLQGRYNDEIRRIAVELGSPWLDVAAEMSTRQEYFVDSVHFSSEGVRALADLLAPALVEALTADPELQTEPSQVGPHSVGPHSAGPHSAGPHSAGPHSAGPHSAGPHSVGPHSAGP